MFQHSVGLQSTNKVLSDPDTLPGSADQCILGNVYLRSNLSRKVLSGQQLLTQECLQYVCIPCHCNVLQRH